MYQYVRKYRKLLWALNGYHIIPFVSKFSVYEACCECSSCVYMYVLHSLKLSSKQNRILYPGSQDGLRLVLYSLTIVIAACVNVFDHLSNIIIDISLLLLCYCVMVYRKRSMRQMIV